MHILKAATTTRSSLSNWPKVVLLGDSITQFSCSREGCWGALLAAKLQRKCDVVNRGFSGYNTRWYKHILPRVVDVASVRDVAAVTICLGTNDSNKPTNRRRHVPLDEYRDNLLYMVDYLQAIGIDQKRLVLITPPPCDEETYTKECLTNERLVTKSQALVEKYAYACQTVSLQSGTRFVNLYAQMIQQKDWKAMLIDGIHLSAAGAIFLHSLVWPHVESLTRHLPIIFPTYRQVDINDPEKSLLLETTIHPSRRLEVAI